MSSPTDFILITGATGFVGHYLVRDLIRRGLSCAVLLRPPLSDSLARLGRLLQAVGLDPDHLLKEGLLVPLEGDLGGTWPHTKGLTISSIVHSAASTRFAATAEGEPHATNVEGTRQLLSWADREGIRRLHLVSTAYVCGRQLGPVDEQFTEGPPLFHNAYEQSKWRAEALCQAWAEAHQACLTVHRPSVVVGEFQSGRAVKFEGFYLLARATELLHRTFFNASDAERQAIPLRLEGRPLDSQNIVPVDYVSGCMAEIVRGPDAPGRVFHITHPQPPTNRLIKRAVESYFGIAGGRFVEPGTLAGAELNPHEQAFHEVSRSIAHYFVDTPVFLRGHTQAISDRAGLTCPTYDEAAIHRLMAYAVAAGWNRKRTDSRIAFSPCAAYFESFLPRCICESRVARMTALSTTIRFIIEDEPEGQWVCRFEEGKLRTVQRGPNGIREDFGYRSTREVFWEAISGATHPQELFLTGRAELFGDIERALKMAAILHEFTREYPCDPRRLADSQRTS